MSVFIGLDTSNYTTSIAAITEDTVYSQRRILPVKAGERGLRQSDAVFQHIKAMPDLAKALRRDISLQNAKAIGVSTRPRNVEGSYMPVFLAGESFASVMADTLGVPMYRFSHQDGHLMAGIYSANAWQLLEKPFLSVHLSGGTTEILKSHYNGDCFDAEIIGGTKDISAGQLIDRVGVACGLQFPCGRELEQLAAQAETEIKLPVSTKESYINFSGAEAQALAKIETTEKPALYRGVLRTVAESLVRALRHSIEETGCRSVLLVGGVAANLYLRQYLQNKLDAEIIFAAPAYSTDNAVGIAVLCKMKEK